MMPVSEREPVVNVVTRRDSSAPSALEPVFDLRGLTVSYGKVPALSNVTFGIQPNIVTAIIGPSGCGKSTFIRCLNRMNDLIPSARVEGEILYHGQDLYADGIDPVSVRRTIGMVFQKPNPFPKSIFDNVAWGLRVLGMKDDLRRAGRASPSAGSALGRGQGPPQAWRARSLGRSAAAPVHRAGSCRRAGRAADGRAASALDPIATTRIEDLMHGLKRDYTIVIVTHNMQQAARVADMTAFSASTAWRTAAGRGSSSSTTRRRRSSPSRPTSAPRTTSRGGSVELPRANHAAGGDGSASGVARGGDRARPASSSRLDQRAARGRPRARRRGDRLRRRGGRAVPGHRAGDRIAARAPDTGRRRPADSSSPSSTRTCTWNGWPISA